MNSFVRILLFTMFVVICSAIPVEKSIDVSPCVDCNAEEAELNRVKRTPQYLYEDTEMYEHRDTYTRRRTYGVGQNIYGPYPQRMPIVEKVVQVVDNVLGAIFNCRY